MESEIKTFALVKNGKVQNVILADDSFLVHIQDQWDQIIEVTQENNLKIGDDA